MLKDVKHNHTVAFLRNWLARNWLALHILEFKKWPKMAVFGHFCYLNALLMHQELS